MKAEKQRQDQKKEKLNVMRQGLQALKLEHTTQTQEIQEQQIKRHYYHEQQRQQRHRLQQQQQQLRISSTTTTTLHATKNPKVSSSPCKKLHKTVIKHQVGKV